MEEVKKYIVDRIDIVTTLDYEKRELLDRKIENAEQLIAELKKDGRRDSNHEQCVICLEIKELELLLAEAEQISKRWFKYQKRFSDLRDKIAKPYDDAILAITERQKEEAEEDKLLLAQVERDLKKENKALLALS